ncbi:MAG: Gfo/Idh/MocA family oxidoreductase [Balneolales bacterium]
MKNNRREFIKRTGLAGAGIFVGGSRNPENREPFPQTQRQRINMSEYAAPKLETVRVGIIGLGNRGSGTTRAMARIEGVEIKAMCDIIPEKVSAAIASIQDIPQHNPDSYSGSEDAWKRLCERGDIDLVYIGTPWRLHTPMAVYAMEHEIHAAVDRPCAVTIDECWQLVETSERTRRHCWMATRSCLDGIKAVALNMVRKGLFGEIIHAEGAYIHNLNTERYNFSKDQYYDMWRLKENATRNGNLYPESGIDAAAPMMDINYGDKMEFMVSVSGNDFSMKEKAREMAAADPFFEPYVDKNYRGNMNVSIIRTARGRSIMIQHDVSTPRPRPGSHLISGTKGLFRHSPNPAIAFGHEGWLPEEEFQSLVEEYTPEISKRFSEMVRQAGGERYSGYSSVRPMDWRLIDCLRNGLPLDMNVYDAALWSALGPLSEWSVANRSHPVQVPDFTAGAWQTSKRRQDIELEYGGTTKLLRYG